MGAEKIDDKDLTNLGIDIVEKTDSESRKLGLTKSSIAHYFLIEFAPARRLSYP